MSRSMTVTCDYYNGRTATRGLFDGQGCGYGNVFTYTQAIEVFELFKKDVGNRKIKNLRVYHYNSDTNGSVYICENKYDTIQSITITDEIDNNTLLKS